jgi:hypothetical protein
MNMDLMLIAKIAGALLAFALGIWIGIGMPGARRAREARDWRSSDRLRATWLNRVFFTMDRPSHRFGTGLIVPKSGSSKSGDSAPEEGPTGPEEAVQGPRRGEG